MTVSRPRPVDLALFAAAIAWGATYLLTKALLTEPAYAPVVVAARMLLAAAVLAVFVRLRGRGGPTRPEIACGLLLGLALSVVFGLETYGVALTSATNAGVLISLCVVLVPFAEAGVRRTRPRPALVVLAGVAVIGAGMLAGGLTGPRPGDLLIVGAALARVVHVTTSGQVQRRHERRAALDPYRLTAVQLGTVGAVFAVLCPIIHAPVGRFVGTLTLPGLGALLCLAIVAGALGFGIQTWGIGRTSAAHASLLLGTEPVWAALFGVAVAGDRLGPVRMAGIVITLGAVLAAQRLTGAAAAVQRAGQHRARGPQPPVPDPPAGFGRLTPRARPVRTRCAGPASAERRGAPGRRRTRWRRSAAAAPAARWCPAWGDRR